MAHVGVLEELEKANIPIDVIVGCSAGAFVGAMYADNPNCHRLKRVFSKINKDSLLDINIWKCRFGLSQGEAFCRALENNLRARNFAELQIPLIAVTTDLYTGELVPIGSGDLIPTIQASCAIPFVFVPVTINGRILVDGGVINPVPIGVARDLGAKIVVAVDLCELLAESFPSNLFGIALRSSEIASMWQSEACTRHADVTIRPKMCEIGTFNDAKKDYLYEAGREAARHAIPKIKEILTLFSEEEMQYFPRHKTIFLPCYAP